MKSVVLFERLRMGVGLSMAWLISMLAMLAWIRRLPSMAILLRRRLRGMLRGESATVTATPSVNNLLWQNNALPGNRLGGFRYDHLRFMIILTPLYLWLELAFGVNLLDKMSSAIPIEETASVEHWGRIISGIAMALLFLKMWFAQCEKWGRGWLSRIVVSLVICVLSIAVMWQIQEVVIEFHVKRSSQEIALSLSVLAAFLFLGALLIRAWVARSLASNQRGLVATLGGLIVIVSIGVGLIANLGPLITAVTQKLGGSETLARNLGEERQQAATLALIRRGIQLDAYHLDTLPIRPEAIDSAEGKATLALFPIVAKGMDEERFEADRVQVLREVMYTDWVNDNGDQVYGAFKSVSQDNAAIRDDAEWLRAMRGTLACFDCEFRRDMPREDYLREMFKWGQVNSVNTALSRLESPEHFSKGRDGESAARAYWVPIWALLFSMVGAFVHLFKIGFTITEYVCRRAFQRVAAADSALADHLVNHGRRLIAAAVVALSLFIFFSDNRVTSNPNYIRLHNAMWAKQPVVGAIAAHWTINAQALLYPFTRKIRPSWMNFESDPLGWLLHKEESEDDYVDEL